MKQISSLFVVFLFDVAFAQKYIITRRVKNSRNEIQPDLVQIPSFLCHDNGTTECPLMDGERHSVCQCACKEQQSFRLYKSTFGFYNGTWKCAKNSVVRQHSGCLLALNGASEIDSVTLPLNDTVRHTLSDLTTGLYIQLPVGTTCTVKAQNSTYLKCTGEWEQLDSTLVAKRFQINYGTPSEDEYFVRVWVNATERLAYPLPSGRIIKLAVTCSDRPWEPSQCIVAKIQGQLECLVASSPTVSSSTAPTKISTQSLSSKQPSSPLSTNVSTQSLSSKQPSSPSSSLFTMQSSSPSYSLTWKPTEKGSGSTSTDNSKAIAGLLGGIAFVVTLIIVILIIRRIKKRKENKQENDDSSNPDTYNKSRPGTRLSAFPPHHSYEDNNQSTDGIECQYDYAVAHPTGKQDECLRPSDNYGYETMEGVDNSLSQNYHICRVPSYEYVKPEKNLKLKQISRPEAEAEKSSEYSSIERNEPHVYESLQIPHEAQEGSADGQKKSLDSSMYGSLVGTLPHVYESLDQVPHKIQEGNAAREKKTVDSSTYGSLEGNVPHTYGPLQIPHETDQQLNPVGQRGVNEYQHYKNEAV